MRIYTFAVGLISATLALEMTPGRVWAIELATPTTVQSENAADLYRQAVGLRKDNKRFAIADDWAGQDKLPKETAAVIEQQKEIIPRHPPRPRDESLRLGRFPFYENCSWAR